MKRNLCLAAAITLLGGWIIVANHANAQSIVDIRDQATVIKQLAGWVDQTNSPAKVAVTSASARTATDIDAFSTVRVVCTSAAYANFGSSTVTATTSSKTYLVANAVEVFNMGNNTRVAFIRDTADGTCFVSILK